MNLKDQYIQTLEGYIKLVEKAFIKELVNGHSPKEYKLFTDMANAVREEIAHLKAVLKNEEEPKPNTK